MEKEKLIEDLGSPGSPDLTVGGLSDLLSYLETQATKRVATGVPHLDVARQQSQIVAYSDCWFRLRKIMEVSNE